MAVYTHITGEALTQYLTGFDIGTLVSFEGITEGIENTNYKVVTTKGSFILTLFEKRVRAEDLPFFISYMEHLHREGIPCPDVIVDKSGGKIVPFTGKPAIIISFLEGCWPRDIEIFHVGALGKLLAQMHLAGEKFKVQRANTLWLPEWKSLIERCGEKPDQLHAGLAYTLKQELDYLERNWPKDLPAGAVHADLFPDNVFFSGQKLTGVIDFYFSCTESFAYDLMLALNAWCFEPEGLNRKKSAALIHAYEELRPLTNAEQEALGFMGRAAALRIVATRLYDWFHPVEGAVVKLKDPMEYARILNFYQMGD